jgi:hypothetical protein
MLLKTEPDNMQALSLKQLINDQVKKGQHFTVILSSNFP